MITRIDIMLFSKNIQPLCDNGLRNHCWIRVISYVGRGSNPTQSISSILVDYGIGLSLFSVIVGQFQQQCHCRILHTF
jgi:hypothetical protein